MDDLFDGDRKGTSGGTWAGDRSPIERGEGPKKYRKGSSPGQGRAWARFPWRSDDPQVFEDLATQIGELWLIISLV